MELKLCAAARNRRKPAFSLVRRFNRDVAGHIFDNAGKLVSVHNDSTTAFNLRAYHDFDSFFEIISAKLAFLFSDCRNQDSFYRVDGFFRGNASEGFCDGEQQLVLFEGDFHGSSCLSILICRASAVLYFQHRSLFVVLLKREDKNNVCSIRVRVRRNF